MKHKSVFVDRLLVTLLSPRHGTTHDVPACLRGVGRSTITRAIGEARPLLAATGNTVAPDVRLRTRQAVRPRRAMISRSTGRAGRGGTTSVEHAENCTPGSLASGTGTIRGGVITYGDASYTVTW